MEAPATILGCLPAPGGGPQRRQESGEVLADVVEDGHGGETGGEDFDGGLDEGPVADGGGVWIVFVSVYC